MRCLLVTTSVVPSSLILVTLMKEMLSSSETSVLSRATWRNIAEDTILHSHLCENVKSYKYDVVQEGHIDSSTVLEHHNSLQGFPIVENKFYIEI
jgi:hypothetical protein